ncbi:MAG: glutathione synthase [Candidatus Ancaeobacter aquaticus]|nr:glutathione synthase [Candidatus Ancaeobacter aquaticus]
MRLGLVVNDIMTEQAVYTTTRLAMAATNRGHEVWYMGVGDFAYDPDENIHARARMVPKKSYKALNIYMRDLKTSRSKCSRITVDDLDVLMLRNDPSTDSGPRFWAQSAGTIFGRVAMRHGVIVVNDPIGLSLAMNKMYFQLFPEEVRPRTLITRDRQDIKSFAKEQGGTIILKPLQGSGGQSVFFVNKENLGNINQMIEAVSRDGYVIAQEYLSAAEEGDVRLFVMNGNPLKHKGKYAAFRRHRSEDDIRSNIHSGGKKDQALVTKEMLNIVEIVRPKIVQDGMFLVGLDVVGDKLMEINVFSPGGLGSAESFEKVNFSIPVIESLERKVDYMKFYRRNFNNVDLATL